MAGLPSCRTAVGKRRSGFDVYMEGCGGRETREDDDEDNEGGEEVRGNGVGDTKARLVMAVVRAGLRRSVRTVRDEEDGRRWGRGLVSNQEVQRSDRIANGYIIKIDIG